MPTPVSYYSTTSLARRSALSPPRFGWAGWPHSAGAGILITAFRQRTMNTSGESGLFDNVDQSDSFGAKAGLAALTQPPAGD
jgi:hypothetical protein